MYTKFFGLNEKPFSITPDPRYLFLSERHSEGLAHLVYGVNDSSGFIQLTGEVGTGKTTLVRTLLARIPSGVDVAFILNPQLSAIEFLTAICEELKITLPEDRGSSKALVDALNVHLLATHAEGRRTILLIDEAQNLATEVLEEVRLLTNLETAKQKLLQIILIAQPELREKLLQSNLRQLAQRITGRYHLEPLSRDESIRYIDHRLTVACGLGEIFDERAKRDIYRLSNGVPRLINVICDRALLGAYSQEVRRVSPQIVRTAASEVSGEPRSGIGGKWVIAAVSVVILFIIVAGLRAMNQDHVAVPSESIALPLIAAQDTPLPVKDDTQTVADEPAQPALDDTLRELASLMTQAMAMETLLSIWGIDYDSSKGTVCSQAQAAGLDCLSQRGSFSTLRQLDRPVVLTLADSLGQTHRPVLVGISDDSAELQFGETRTSYPIAELADLWYGQYLLIWQPPNGNPSLLQPGAQGPKVRWLRQSLVALGSGLDAPASDSDVFDSELERQLIEFQRRNRLETDGLAGPQTQIIINTQLGLEGIPSLSGS